MAIDQTEPLIHLTTVSISDNAQLVLHCSVNILQLYLGSSDGLQQQINPLITGSDVSITEFYWNSGLVNTSITAQDAVLLTSEDKVIGDNCHVTVFSSGKFLEGTLIGKVDSLFLIDSTASFRFIQGNISSHSSTFLTPLMLIINGNVTKESPSVFLCAAEVLVGPNAEFSISEGTLILANGGKSLGVTLVVDGSTLIIGTNFSPSDFKLESDSHTVIDGELILNRRSTLLVFGCFQAVNTVYASGLFIFSNEMQLLVNTWTCSDFCSTIVRYLDVALKLDSLTVINGGFVSFSNVTQSVSILTLTVTSAVVSFSTGDSPLVETVELNNGIICGSDEIIVANSFFWHAGRLGSLRHSDDVFTITVWETSLMQSKGNKYFGFRTIFNNYGNFSVVDSSVFSSFSNSSFFNFNSFNHGYISGNGAINDPLESFSFRHGTVTIKKNSLFEVYNSHLSALQSSTWNGLGSLSTNIQGVIEFSGNYNLSLYFIQVIGDFTFTSLANIELDTVTVHGGELVFENCTERSELFDLDYLEVTDGRVDLLDIGQHLWFKKYEQNGGTVRIQNVSHHFTIDSFTINKGNLNISDVLLNTTFLSRALCLGGQVEMMYLYRWLIFEEGLYVAPVSTFTVKHVFNSVWTAKDFHLRGKVNFSDLHDEVLIADVLVIDQNNNAHVYFTEVANSFVILNGTEIRSGYLTLTSLNADLVTKYLKVYSVPGFNSPNVIVSKIVNMSVEQRIEVSGFFTIDGYYSVDVPIFLFLELPERILKMVSTV
ncbi:hypothetical protein GEMRC1_010601 [Eukaryota sp. GEM-RC1]